MAIFRLSLSCWRKRVSADMQGITTWINQAGANDDEVSRVIYSLAHAISVGYVKLIDWKTIENANMATASFKETAINAALELGTLQRKENEFVTVAKGNAVSVSNFNEALSDGWFTRDVLVKTLDRYGSSSFNKE